jgi:hypothetical protein
MHATDCNVDVLEVLTSSTDMFTIQCAAVYTCSVFSIGCRTKMLYSQAIQGMGFNCTGVSMNVCSCSSKPRRFTTEELLNKYGTAS